MIVRRPLLHIGLPKTGTTYLQRILAANLGKGYFHREIQALNGYQARWLLQWKIRKVSTSGLGIAFSHEGLLSGDRWKKAAGMLNQPCILVTTREPLAWLQSHYKHDLRKGCPLEPKDWIIERQAQFTRSLDFNRIRAELGSLVGETNVRFLPFELLRDDTTALLRELNHFVDGRLKLVETPFEALNQSLPLSFLGRLQQMNARLVKMAECQHRKIEKASPEVVGETEGFVRRFPELRNALMVGTEMKIGVKHLQDTINFLTKCLLQNVPENIELVPHLDTQQTDDFRRRMEDAFQHFVTTHLTGKLSCLANDPAYAPYHRDYRLT